VVTGFGQARAILQIVRLFPRAHRGLTLLYWIITAIHAGIPIAAIVATTNLARVSARYLIEPAVEIAPAFEVIFPAVLIVALLFLAQQIVGPFSYWANDALGDRFSELWRERVMSAALSPSGVAHLENPSSADRIWLAAGLDQRSLAPAHLVGAVSDIVVWRLQGFGSALLLAQYACGCRCFLRSRGCRSGTSFRREPRYR
jgi:ATP-binding cassette, subfamily B, bacterial